MTPRRKTTGSLKIIHERFAKNVSLLEEYKVGKGGGGACGRGVGGLLAGGVLLPSLHEGI